MKSNHSIRLDRYLKKLYPYLTQGMIQSSLRKGHIKIDGQKVKANHHVDEQYYKKIFISAHLIVKQESQIGVTHVNIIKLSEKILSEYLVFNCKDFIAINKPYNLATQSGTRINISVDDALKYLNTQGNDFKLVHRLDKSSSGLLLIAKSGASARKLTQAFKDHLLTKTYYAIVSKIPIKSKGQIINKILKVKDYDTYEKVQIDDVKGKLAITDYEVIKTNNKYSLLKFIPKTGRMHQLRVHAKKLGCSIVGDIKYDGIKHSRLLLHAKEILIPKQIFGEKLIISTDLPQEFIFF